MRPRWYHWIAWGVMWANLTLALWHLMAGHMLPAAISTVGTIGGFVGSLRVWIYHLGGRP